MSHEHRCLTDILADLTDASRLIQSLTDELNRTQAHLDGIQHRLDKRRWRQRRYLERLKKKRHISTQADVSTPKKAAKSTHHLGVTWRDVPGKDPANKRMNFSLFRLGKLWTQFGHLHGDELKTALATLGAQNKINGAKGGGARKMESLRKNES